MTKDAYYFSHDANARNDEKILMLRADYGWEGYGLYWALVEMMFESSDTCLSLDKIKGIAISNNVDITLLQSVINTCLTQELFVSDDVKFWSESLVRRKEKYQDIKRKKSEAGKKGMAKRWANQQKDNTVITDDNVDITKDNKGKERKGNELKETKEDKNRYLEFVFLKESEHERLVNEYGKELIDSKIEDLDNYLGSTGKPNKYKDHNRTIRSWIKKDNQQTKSKKIDWEGL